MMVEFDSEQNTITIDGVAMSLEVLSTFANPDPAKLYRMRRVGNVVIVHEFMGVLGDVKEADA